MTDDLVVPIISTPTTEEAAARWIDFGLSRGGAIFRGIGGNPTHERVLDLARRLGTPRRSVVGLDDSSIDLVYDITPRGDGLKDVRGQTILSTTFRDFALHTDGYNADPPPRLMILQVAIAGIGGLTTLARVGDAVALLSPAAIESLMDPVFPAAPGPTAILSSHGGAWRARYNGHEINRFLAAGEGSGFIEGRHLSALTELSDALSLLESRAEGRLHLQEGDVVVLDNQLTLHGRLALAAEDRDRLLHRVWCA